MVTTSPDGLFSPDGPSQYNLTVDLAAMQVSNQAALTNRVRHYTATTVAGLPTTGLAGSNPSGWTTNDQREWRWTGTKWALVGGRFPTAQTKLSSAFSLTTGGNDIPTTNNGFAAGGQFTIPAGCGGIYDFSFSALLSAETAAYIQPTINGTNTGWESANSSQRGFSGSGILSVNAGDVVRFRGRTFSGTVQLDVNQTYFHMAYRCQN